MILSHAHRFIFIKTRKTGGTSVEIALSKYLGPDDIASPLERPDEEKRAAHTGRCAQNYRIAFSDYGALDWLRYLTGRLNKNGSALAVYKNHMSARAVRRRVGTDIWSRYFSFAIERNPWDKVVSGYYWQYRNVLARSAAPSFDEFIRSGTSIRYSDFKLYSDEGGLIVDRVLPYEDLGAELQAVATRIGLPETPDISRRRVNAKAGLRPEGDYRSHYTPELRGIVARQFAREIELMGYEF